MIVMGLAFMARASVHLLDAIKGAHITLSILGVNVADLLVCAFWVVGGLLLLKKSKVGYVMSFISFFQAVLLFIALLIFMVIQPMLCATSFIWIDFLVIAVTSLIFFIPFMLLVRANSSH